MIHNLLTIAIFPLLLALTQLKLSQNNINTQNRDYEVIEATTGKKTDNIEYYAEDPVIETHRAAVSAIKKALANEGIDTSKVRIMLYYDPIAIRDDSPPRIWNSKSHPNTVSSPWLDLTKTVTTSGETRITIRIDATSSRVINDLFSKFENKRNASEFLKIPSIRESCFKWISDQYPTVRLKSEILKTNNLTQIFNCAPEEIRESLLLLFKSSNQSTTGSFTFNAINQLNYSCQDVARQYYSELYPRLAIQGLQNLKSEFKSEFKWWTEIINQIEPIQKCQRQTNKLSSNTET